MYLSVLFLKKLYKRLLNTMGLRKPINIKKTESITSIKQIKTTRRTKIEPSRTVQANTLLLSDDSVQYLKNTENEKPVLITYQAVPGSVFNK